MSLFKQKGEYYICARCSTSVPRAQATALVRYCGIKNAYERNTIADSNMVLYMLEEASYDIPKPIAYEPAETDPIDEYVNPFFYEHAKTKKGKNKVRD